MAAERVAQYCGHCLQRFAADDSACPACRSRADDLDYRQAQRAIVNALGSTPAGQARAHLIRLIGERATADASSALVERVLECALDRDEGLAAVECVERLLTGPTRRQTLQRLHDTHDDDAVRLAVLHALMRHP